MSDKEFGLIFAWGPHPKEPEMARVLGAEEATITVRIFQSDDEGFDIYVHAASVPELVALCRSLGRDVTFEPFAEKQALLHVASKRSSERAIGARPPR
jgi:hypothetical protein